MMQRKNLSQLSDALIAIPNKKEMEKFLVGILTPQELIDIPQRLQIVKLLKKGTPQRVIADKLKVGIATVTRGSREIQKGSFDLLWQNKDKLKKKERTMN